MYAPWDGRRVPVLLLGGYLGAGKTTLINEMLRRTDVPIAVLVNDVGAVNIDAELIRRHEGDTLDLTGGCVCCSLKNGFLEAFDELRAGPVPPELVVVELSGVADPRSAASLSETPGFTVDSVAVLVDLEQFLDFEAESSVVADSVRAQVEA
ncbi:MAG: GTP-binding protein, partial [Acidimicrobiales bacterium]